MDDVLISRAAAIAWFFRPYSNEESYSNMDVKRALEALPAVDARPVIRGYWKGWTSTHWNKRYTANGDPEYIEHTYYSCSNCRRRTVIRENYCPTCGAQMFKEDLDADMP